MVYPRDPLQLGSLSQALPPGFSIIPFTFANVVYALAIGQQGIVITAKLAII
jgi:hypothetical protein